MIQFFRKIRQSLLSENRFRKYLLYALGEIILVVIGILIALAINNQNEQDNNRARIENIIDNAYYNLESDLIWIDAQLSHFKEKDSMIQLVREKKVGLEDYQAEGLAYQGLIAYVEPIQFKRQAYDRLINNIEIIPQEYLPIVDLLQLVYDSEALLVNKASEESNEFYKIIRNEYRKEYPWFSNRDSILHGKQRVDFMLNNEKYLMDLSEYQWFGLHVLQHLRSLKRKTTEAYNLIHEYRSSELSFSAAVEKLDEVKIKNEIILPIEVLETYTGQYFFEKRDTITVSIKNNHLVMKPTKDPLVELIATSTDKFRMRGININVTFTKNEEGLVHGFELNFEGNIQTAAKISN